MKKTRKKTKSSKKSSETKKKTRAAKSKFAKDSTSSGEALEELEPKMQEAEPSEGSVGKATSKKAGDQNKSAQAERKDEAESVETRDEFEGEGEDESEGAKCGGSAENIEESAGQKVSESSRKNPPAIGFRAWRKRLSPMMDGPDDEDGRRLDQQTQLGLVTVAVCIYLANLNFGLWDCWEPHYAETARMMLVRKDWLHPYWSYAYFLSKPILIFVYMAASMSVFGVNEFAIRLPFALHAIFLIWSVYFVVSRLFTRRAGLLAAIVVGTAPLTTFLGRQAIADIIVTSYLTAGLGFFALAIFGDRKTRQEAQEQGTLPPVQLPYLYLFYALMGLALLTKGMMGAGLAGFVVLGYLLLSGDWALLLRVRLVSGVFLTLLIAVPWYLHMSFFEGRNIDDHKTFVDRFLLHDNLYRLFKGVHGERGSFVYFVQQLGYALGIWIGFLPAALVSFGRFRQSKPDVNERLYRFLFAWWFCALLLFSLSQTKFHHYVFPVLPISAMLIGIWLDRFLRYETKAVFRYGLLLVLALFCLVLKDVTDNPQHLVNLFVYKYSRPYPWTDPMLMFGIDWTFSVPILSWFQPFVVTLRPTPQVVLRDILLVGSFLLLFGFFYNARRVVTWGFCALGIFFAFYNAQSWMLDLTKHWSQKGYAERLKKDSKLWRSLLRDPLSDARKAGVPAEPLFAFRMNWRGEKFYFRNYDVQIMGDFSYQRLHDALQRHRAPNQRAYFLIEASRLKQLRRALGTEYSKRLRLLDRSNNKYKLYRLNPDPPGWKPNASQLQRDEKNRIYYDDWARKWRRDKRRKQRRQRQPVYRKKKRRARRVRRSRG